MSKSTLFMLTPVLLSSTLAVPLMAAPHGGADQFRNPLAMRLVHRLSEPRAMVPHRHATTSKPRKAVLLDPSYTIVDEPDADPSIYGTRLFGINEKGQLSGQYVDGSGQFHAFIATPNGDGTFNYTTITVDDSDTFSNILNDKGETFGGYVNQTGAEVPWLRLPDGTIKTFTVNEAVGDTIATWLNNKGQIAGFYFDENGTYHSYVREKSGAIFNIDDPDAGTGPGQGTNVVGINNHGDVTGASIDGNDVLHPFIRSHDGTIEDFSVDGAGSDAGQGAYGIEIEDNGWIAGGYIDSNFVTHGFLRKPDGTIIAPIDPPDMGTGPGQGVDEAVEHFEAGWGIGDYIDANDVHHGFFCKKCKTDDRKIVEFDPPGAGDIGTYAVISSDRNHVIVGTFKDENGIRHGFIRKPKKQ